MVATPLQRWRVLSGPPSGGSPDSGSLSAPTAGGHVEAVDQSVHLDRWAACIGQVFKIESGAAISDGDDLATDGQGRAVPASSGDVIVARALESAGGSGEATWVVMTNQSDTA